MPFQSCAGWKIASGGEIPTDATGPAVVTTGSDGFRFAVYRAIDNTIWGRVSIPESSFEQFDQQRLLLYRIDSLPVEDVGAMRRLSSLGLTAMFDSRPQTVAFRIYGDSTDAPIRGTLASLLSGKKLTVRAFLAAGGHKEVTFDIEKGEHLIRRTLAIKGRRATEADLRDAEKSIEGDRFAGDSCGKLKDPNRQQSPGATPRSCGIWVGLCG